MTSLDIPRKAYMGALKQDPLTEKLTLQYPMRLTLQLDISLSTNQALQNFGK